MAVSRLSIAESIAWRWLIVGVVLVVVSLGSVQSYFAAAGARARFVGWSEGVGVFGRAVVVTMLAAVLLGAIPVSGVPGSSVFTFGNGGLLAVVGLVAIELIQHREMPERSAGCESAIDGRPCGPALHP